MVDVPLTDRTREQRLHDMTSAEEHIAMRILCDRYPEVFDAVADVIEKIRAADARVVRTQPRPTLNPLTPTEARDGA